MKTQAIKAQVSQGTWQAMAQVSELMPTSTLPVRHPKSSMLERTSTPNAATAPQAIPEIALQTLRNMSQPVVIIDQQLAVRFCNLTAASLLDDNPVIDNNSGALQCFSGDAQQQLLRAINALSWQSHVGSSDLRTLRLENKNRGVTMIITLRRFLGRFTGMGSSHHCLYMVAFHQLGRPRRIDTAMLQQAFDMTVAEAAIAGLLAQGYEPCQIAAIRNVSVETVRAQLRNVFAKTSAKRQADVVRIVVELSVLVPEGGRG